MGKFYVYINQNDLLRFLVVNSLYPYNNTYSNKRSLSLLKDNAIFISTKKYTKTSIMEFCKEGLFDPVVLEVSLKVLEGSIKVKDGYLIKDPITFNSIDTIYYVDNKIITPLYDDIYLFNGLRNEIEFPFGKVTPDLEDFENVQFPRSDTFDYFDKIQAFYMARFGFVSDFAYKGKKLLFMRNIDEDSFKYISSVSYSDFIYKLYGKTLIVPSETTFLNDNFETILKACVHKEMLNNSADFEFYYKLYSLLFDYKTGDDFANLISITFGNDFEKTITDSNNFAVDEMRDLFNKTKDRRIITLLILNRILPMNISDAKDYINNFVKHSEFEKELVSLYGLANGMKKINAELKRRADLLMVSYNKAINIIGGFSYSLEKDYSTYFSQRSFETECVLDSGFNLQIFDFKEEIAYVNEKLSSFLVSLKVPAEIINSKIINDKKITSRKLHELFIRFKKEEK